MEKTLVMRLAAGGDQVGFLDLAQLPKEGTLRISIDNTRYFTTLALTWEEPDPPRDATPDEWRRRTPQDAYEPIQLFDDVGY